MNSTADSFELTLVDIYTHKILNISINFKHIIQSTINEKDHIYDQILQLWKL